MNNMMAWLAIFFFILENLSWSFQTTNSNAASSAIVAVVVCLEMSCCKVYSVVINVENFVIGKST